MFFNWIKIQKNNYIILKIIQTPNNFFKIELKLRKFIKLFFKLFKNEITF